MIALLVARLYANENFPLPVVLELRRWGHDILTTQDAGKSDQAIPDKEVLEFAAAEDRVVLTLNRLHFIRLHKIDGDHQGIIACTYDPNFLAQATRINALIQEQPILAGLLLRVNRHQYESRQLL